MAHAALADNKPVCLPFCTAQHGVFEGFKGELCNWNTKLLFSPLNTNAGTFQE